jgi:PAS domain S-box-containing protein
MAMAGEELADLNHRSILDGLRDAVVASDLRGRIVYVNDAVTRILGWPAIDLLGASLHLLIPERYRGPHDEGFVRYRSTGETRLVGRVARVPALRADGSEVNVELALETLDTIEGELVVASMRDVTALAEMERQSKLGRYLAATNAVALHLGATRPAAALSEAASVVLPAVGNAMAWAAGSLWEVDDDGALMHRVGTWTPRPADFEPFFAATVECTFAPGTGNPGRAWASGQPVWVTDVEHDTGFTRREHALAVGLHGAVAFPVLGAEDRVLGAVEFFDPMPHDPDEDLLEVLGTIGRQVGQFVERARADRRARSQLRFLAEASRELDATLDFDATLRRVASLAVPQIADLCIVDVQRDGRLQRMAWAAADEETQAALDELIALQPETPQEAPAASVVISAAGPQLVEHVTEDVLRQFAGGDDERMAILRRVGLRSMIAVPLLARGRVIGAMSLATQRRTPFHDEDLAIAMELARRAGVALDNARLYEERSKTAMTLQQSLLPRMLPEIPGTTVHPAYLPGSGDAVGGDFYDVYRRGDDCWVIVVGDVCGKDTVAAAMTGLVRHTLRALDHVGTPFGEMLPKLNAVVLSSDFADRFCTVNYIRWQPTDAGATATIASAGHPLPFVRRRSGDTAQVGRTGELIGVFDDIESPATTLELAAGDGLLLYTDGIIERHGEAGWFGEDRLREVIANSSGAPEEMVQTIVDAAEAFAPDAARDDIAVLSIRSDVGR